MAFTVSNDKLALAQMNSTPKAFTSDTIISLPTPGGGFLARSSPSDQYVYLSLAGGKRWPWSRPTPGWRLPALVFPIPWTRETPSPRVISRFNFNPIKPVLLSSSAPTPFKLRGRRTLKTGSVTVEVADGETVGIGDLQDGPNILTVEVTANSRTGGTRHVVNADIAPTHLNFSRTLAPARSLSPLSAERGRHCPL